MLTNRDKQYLRTVFLLQETNGHVGPNILAAKMGVTKVCAFQKMRRLEAMGYGEYEPHKGLKLNLFAIQTIEQDIKKHHLIEKFLEDSLKITFQEACEQSNHIGPFISDKLMNNIIDMFGEEMDCNCGNCFDSKLNSAELGHCHWLKKGV